MVAGPTNAFPRYEGDERPDSSLAVGDQMSETRFPEGDDMRGRVQLTFDQAVTPGASDPEKSVYESLVDGLALPEEAREKLKAMMTIEEYNSAVGTYHEMGGIKTPPTRNQIVAEIMSWSVDRLRKECEMREKPTLVIVSDHSFGENITAMDANKHYSSSKGGGQGNAYVYGGAYVNAPEPNKGRVSIVDGVVHPKPLKGVSRELGEGRHQLTEAFSEKGMRHIDGVEMQTLLQKSLREAHVDAGLIVDDWKSGKGTLTILNPESLAESTLVAYATFAAYRSRPYFFADTPDVMNNRIRGRASVTVMEF
jgi:hypothetical protein